MIAVAIVESENLSSWNWFLNSINMNMPINQKDVKKFSDREKGIINATNAISPLSSKAYCVRHIAKNLRLSFRDKNAMDYFWKAVNTYSVQEFTAIMESLKHHNLQFYERVASIGVETWANSMFPIPRFSKMTTNPVESMNSALKRFVDQDICSLILSINNCAMQIYNERRQKRFQASIVDPCLKALNKNISLGRLFTIQPSNSDVYLVDHKYVVNLPNKTCECKEGVDVGIPCRHVCAVLRNNHVDPSNFVAKVYLSDTYYSQFLRNILPLSFLTLTRSDITSPIAGRSRGRPRIRRIPAPFETN